MGNNLRLTYCNNCSLKVKDIPNKGMGVVAKVKIDQDSYICEYTGDIITYEEAKSREEKYLGEHDVKGLDYQGYIFFFHHYGKKLW